jgi:hypothetical protein
MYTLPPVFWVGYVLAFGGTLLAARWEYGGEKGRGFFWPVTVSVAVSLLGAAAVLLVLPANESDYWLSHPGMFAIDAWFGVISALALSAIFSAVTALASLLCGVLSPRRTGIWRSVTYALLASAMTSMTFFWTFQRMPME